MQRTVGPRCWGELLAGSCPPHQTCWKSSAEQVGSPLYCFVFPGKSIAEDGGSPLLGEIIGKLILVHRVRLVGDQVQSKSVPAAATRSYGSC